MGSGSVKDAAQEALTSLVINAAMQSGLNWDEAIAAFGRGAKALAKVSAMFNDGNVEHSVTLAGRAFHEGLASDVVIDIGTVAGLKN